MAKKDVTVEEAFQRGVEALERAGANYALVGGLAVIARAKEARLTTDVDFAVEVESDAEAEAIVHACAPPLSVHQTFQGVRDKRLRTVRMYASGPGTPHVDFLFDTSGIEQDAVALATSVPVLGREVPTARIGHLLAMKLLSEAPRRGKDASDILWLLDVAHEVELELCRHALQVITDKGRARDKDLFERLAWYRKVHAEPPDPYDHQ